MQDMIPAYASIDAAQNPSLFIKALYGENAVSRQPIPVINANDPEIAGSYMKSGANKMPTEGGVSNEMGGEGITANSQQMNVNNSKLDK